VNAGLSRLTTREREVLRLLARGHDIKSVASELGVSAGAVNERLREARRKLGVSSSREAARILAADEGIPNSSVDIKSGIEARGAEDDPHAARTGPGPAGASRYFPLAITGAAMFALVLSAAASWTASDRPPVTPAAAPGVPRVVATSPRPGATIAPGPFTLFVKFDQPMREGSYSFVQKAAETYPECPGRPALSRDRRTYALECTALPGRRYEIWLNSPPWMNFKNMAGVPAQPFQLLFQTRGR
jgi:DNA-binding CsgD family transcriptional regulator